MKIAIIMLAVLGVASAVVPTCHLPGEDDLAVQFPNPADCTSFYKCLELTPVLHQCPAGLWYNPELQVCDYPYNIPEGACQPPSK